MVVGKLNVNIYVDVLSVIGFWIPTGLNDIGFAEMDRTCSASAGRVEAHARIVRVKTLVAICASVGLFLTGCGRGAGVDRSTPAPSPTHHCRMDVVGATPHPSC